VRFPLIGVLILLPLAAAAAGPFDGKWKGNVTVCGGTRVMSLVVAGSDVSGLEEWPNGKSLVSGQVSATGKFEGNVFGQGEFAGKFTVDAFSGSHMTKCGNKLVPGVVPVVLKPTK